jgi:type II secretory pathway pseudopilin PulG
MEVIPAQMIARAVRRLSQRLATEEGFTLVEALVAITVLSVGAFAVAQAMLFGLGSSGLARQRLAARTALDQQMETARSLNYDNLVLSDPDPGLTHATDPDDPDFWVDTTNQTYDPDGAGSLAPEGLVRVAGSSPSLEHYQNPLIQGATTYSVYRYVTWVDSPTDGLGVSDVDTNGDDANGEDYKRVTIVVTWTDELGRGQVLSTQSSLFSDGRIGYKAPAANSAPSVSCPTVTQIGDLQYSFTAVASDTPPGTIASYSWSGGDGLSGNTATITHTYPAGSYGTTYGVVTSVTDNQGSPSNNVALACTVTTNANPNAGVGGPNVGDIVINGGAARTKSAVVTLTLSKAGGTSPTYMSFSNDGITWSTPVAFGTSTTWTLVSGDETKRVYTRFYDDTAAPIDHYGDYDFDDIILDTTAPARPTGLTATTTIQGSNTVVDLSWTAPIDTDLAGYRVWRRDIASTTWTQVTCPAGTACTDSHKKSTSYEYYVEAYDLAGNTSAQSNHVTA